MTQLLKPSYKIFFSIGLFLMVFAVLSSFYIPTTQIRDLHQFETHAAIIADDLWALNQPGLQSYLQLAAQAGYYRTLAITQPDGTPYLSIVNIPLSGIERFLHSTNLIGIKNLSANITYNNATIGTLHGEQYVRVIYPLLHLLIFLLCVVVVTLFIGNLFSNRKQLEQQVLERTKNLRESERRFHDLVNLLPEMVWETDTSGRVTYANQLALTRLGMVGESSKEQNWLSIIVHEQRKQAGQYFLESMQGNQHGLQEFTAQASDGKTFPLLIRSAPIYRNNRISGARSVAIDITERQDLEEQLRRAQRMKAIGLMAGGVAHDLNNILSGIVTYPELLLMDLPQKSPLRPAIETIRKSGLAAAEVVSDLLTVARGVAASKTVANLNLLVEEYLSSPEYLQLKSRYPEIAVTRALTDDLQNISCSPIHIRKCLMNLVINAAEAVQGSGRIAITTANQAVVSPVTDIESLKQGRYTVLTVTDTGPGIPKDDLTHIFEPFYTKKIMGRSGTGLGLTVVWNTIREHDGAVKVTSDSKGTSFELFFPAVDQRIQETFPEKDWREYTGDGERILVIDDEAQQRDIASKLLTSLKYTVNTVSSGEEAVAYLHHNVADLLILDMLMEPGQNGRQTYEQILKIHPAQKAIIASGYSESEDVKVTLELGACSFIHKPYTIKQLGQLIHRELNRNL